MNRLGTSSSVPCEKVFIVILVPVSSGHNSFGIGTVMDIEHTPRSKIKRRLPATPLEFGLLLRVKQLMKAYPAGKRGLCAM